METILKIIQDIAIIPVVKITDESQSIPLAKALAEGGIDIMEITFRSEHAIAAMQAIAQSNPEILLGAGTVSTAQQAADAVAAGAKFVVTPGFNHEVVKWCVDNNIIALPGIQTPSEIEMALSYGIKNMKFFPAATSGGPQFLKDISGPYSQVRIMPSGGINKNNMHDYLSLNNVLAIGGSFMLPQDKIESHDWDTIAKLSADAVQSLLNLELVAFGSPQSDNTKLYNTLSKVSNLNVVTSQNAELIFTTPYLDSARYQLAKSHEITSIDETSFSIKDKTTSIIIKQL